MTTQDVSSQRSDVLIVGAGPAGLSLAASLAQAGMQVTVLEQQPASTLAAPPADGREIALTHPSVATLQRIGSWQRLAAHEVGLLREAQVHDGPVGQRGAMQLHAGGSGVQHLGWIVPNHALRRTAYEVAAHTPGVRLVTEARVTRVAVTPAHAELEYTDTRNLDAAPLRLQGPAAGGGRQPLFRHAAPVGHWRGHARLRPHGHRLPPAP